MSSPNTGFNTGTSPTNFLLGAGIMPQILFAFVAGLILFIALFSIESIVKTFNNYSTAKTELIPNTVMSSKAIVIRQDPSDPRSKMILASDNERTGIEFTYTFFLYIEPDTFNQGSDTVRVLKQVFHKGYSAPFPLVGPGVFVVSDKNALRIVMNSYKTWYNFVDIENVPVQKWFHIALVMRKNNLEVYVNGNMKGRIAMEDTVPYQNYQNLILFGSRPCDFIFEPTNPLANYKVGGAMSGQLSRLTYYRYALSFSEIQSSANKGPSTTIDQPDNGPGSYLPNALTDTWYTAGQ